MSKQMKTFSEMNRQDQEAHLMLPIINELKQLGGQSTTKELKRAVVVDDELISENVLTVFTTSRNGRKYLPFDYPFNFAISNLVMAGMLDRPNKGTVKLTEKARSFKGNSKELSEKVYKISMPLWRSRSKKNKDTKRLDQQIN